MLDFDFVLSEDFPRRTRRQLLNLFYKQHVYKERDGRTCACHPISLILNPIPFVIPDDPCSNDVYVAVYHKAPHLDASRYYVTIDENIHHSMVGPHSVKLHIQVYPGSRGKQMGKQAWLGSMQMMCNFHSIKKVHAKLRRAIRLKQYYASEDSLQEEIIFDKLKPIEFEFR